MEQISSDIIERCRVGDKTAFRTVVQHYQRMVLSLAFRMLCNEEEAKDLTQETFIRVWLNFPKYDASRSLATWIYTIATFWLTGYSLLDYSYVIETTSHKPNPCAYGLFVLVCLIAIGSIWYSRKK